MTTYPLLLISGIPATGKTTFGHWLQNEKSFRHFDVEETQLIPDMNAMRMLNCPVVLTWGFRPDERELSIVEHLKNQGFSAWWFSAETPVARDFFVRRRGIPVAYFDIQMSLINQEWEKIARLFSPNIIVTLSREGYLSPDLIYQRIAADLGGES